MKLQLLTCLVSSHNNEMNLSRHRDQTNETHFESKEKWTAKHNNVNDNEKK